MANRNTKSSFSTNAYESIKGLILENKLAPGEAVTEQSLADHLNIGRTPIREALKKLEQESLIVTENRRKRVNALNVSQVNQIYELKVCIESYMAGLAASRADEKQRALIEGHMQQMEEHALDRVEGQAPKEEWFAKWMQLDADLHESIYRAAGNEKSIEIIRSLNISIHRFKLGLLTLKGRIDISVLEHRRFVDDILAQRPAEAQAHMSEHLQNVQAELVKIMSIFPAAS